MELKIFIEAENLENILRTNIISEKLKEIGVTIKNLNLKDANLEGANLDSANLVGADLTGAKLTEANLAGANLRHADLTCAKLTEANLKYADLTGTNLGDANLRHADLTGAKLTEANLKYTDLTGTNLGDANLAEIKKDIMEILESNKKEVQFLCDSLLSGKVNGCFYEGPCACLLGTIANSKKIKYTELAPNSSRPAERFFLAIKEGDTPENNQVSAIVVEWIREFIEKNENGTITFRVGEDWQRIEPDEDGFVSSGAAITLEREQIGTHDSGWTITGEIHEDYYFWVNYFEANHPKYGKLSGDYEEEIIAESVEAFEHFYKNHPPHRWDYNDI